MSSAPKYIPHYTLADYRQWEGDWELWSGVPVAMTPSPFGRHQWVAGNILSELKNQLGRAGCTDCYVIGETDWIISDDTVVRPDVSVVCGIFPERFIEGAPEVVVEVLSERTAEKDRTVKYDLYRQAGVRYYLMADPVQQTIKGFALEASNDGSEIDHYSEISETDQISMELSQRCTIQLAITRCFR